MNRYIAILLAIVIFSSPAFNAALNDKNATSFEILAHLKTWGALMLSPYEDADQKKYIVLDLKSLRFISPYAKEYRELSKNETGRILTENGPQLKKYLYGATGQEVWTNNAAGYLIGAIRDPDNNWNFLAFDGQAVYRAQLVNPKLSAALPDYYVPWQETTACPLQIKAYHIEFKSGAESSASLVVQNTANKDITHIKGSVALFDYKQKPVLMGGGNREAVDRAVAIPALSPCLAIDFWATDQPVDFRIISPVITEIQFKDGTVWRKQ